jgi:hypothetical protein
VQEKVAENRRWRDGVELTGPGCYDSSPSSHINIVIEVLEALQNLPPVDSHLIDVGGHRTVCSSAVKLKVKQKVSHRPAQAFG